jgi:hypothetical protein
VGAAPANEATAPYFPAIPIRVVSAYGRTTLDMLSSGPHTGDDQHDLSLARTVDDPSAGRTIQMKHRPTADDCRIGGQDLRK